jgi:hypothetical protein
MYNVLCNLYLDGSDNHLPLIDLPHEPPTEQAFLMSQILVGE